ncbi:MAG: hypothetical protein HWD89_02730 [Tenacibaculum sp.]|uniref:hypothetical protein n=1 Tax=Tenacibaculum sp. TaxID=1906242 RepID=UPI00180CD4E3|nr:hypothetical protein [Tenacibaculum sp.]NVK07939.1 hypothetical protein [Tenacibaculum sp.]
MRSIKYLLLILIFSLFSCKKNNLNIKVTKDVKKNDLKIMLKTLDENNKPKNYLIFNEGSKNDIPNGYGENDWTVYYKDSLIVSFRHFKTNRNHKHDYNFDFNFLNGEFKYSISIDGNDTFNLKNQ